MMFYKKVLVLFLVLVVFTRCQSQSSAGDIVYSAPFDSLSIEYHKERIGWGVGYLLLVKSNNKVEEDFYLVDSRLDEFVNGLSYTSLDNLFNGKISSPGFKEMIPISDRILTIYDKIEICELAKQIFEKDGYYQSPFYLNSSNYILSSLVKRGAEITIGDLDGELFIKKESVRCSYLD